MAVHLFAGIRVRDYEAARPWYERLLGTEPTFVPHATECVWDLDDGRSVYVVEDAERAGGAVLMLFVDDLDATMTDIATRDLEPVRIESYPGGVRKAVYLDADGNEIGFGGSPPAA